MKLNLQSSPTNSDRRNLPKISIRYVKLAFTLFFGLLLSGQIFGQYSQDFEPSGDRGTANCVIVSDMATINRTQANPVIAGSFHATSGQLTTSNKFWETPWLDLTSGASITFKHKRNNTSTTNAFVDITITDAATNTSNVIWTYNYNFTGAPAAGTILNPTVSLGVTGVYKIRIRGGGTNGSTRYALDDIVITNGTQSTIGAGSSSSSVCNPAIPGVTAPIANNDSATTSTGTAVTFSISNNDTPQTNPLNPARIDLDPTTSAIEVSRTVTGEGTFSVDSSGNLTFTPVSGFSGTSSITYTIRDTVGAISNAATVSVAVSNELFACSDALYFTSSANTNVYRYTPSSNSLIQLSGVSIDYGTAGSGSAGAAITPGGFRLYFNDRVSPRQLRYNIGGTTNTIAAAQVDNSNNVQRNAIDSSGNGFYSLGQTASPNTYYRYTTGGATSTISGPFTLTVQPSTAPAIGIGGDIAFDGNNVGYLVDQNRNLYRLDVTT
ncbi:MAG: cadherin-like domain-containing protein, partial [Blastocatellia bacterium]|nr:cadherin-like domain-containing protein [Blastocatellia bacterium]